MKGKNSVAKAVKETITDNMLLSVMLAAVIGCSIFVGIIPPLVLERIINLLTQGIEIPFSQVLQYFLLLALSGILDGGRETMITVFGQKATHCIRRKMCEKLKKLPSDYYTGQDNGTTVSRFVNDVDTVEILFTSGVISMVADAFRIVSILWVIFVKSPGLGVLLVFVLPLLYILTRFIQKRMLTAQLDNRNAVGMANNHVPDTIKNIRMIHNLGREKYMEKRYDSYIQDSFRAVNRVNFYDAVYSPVIITVSAVLVAVMMTLSAKGDVFMEFFGMSVGTAVAVISYVGRIFEPLESIGMEIQNIQAAAAGIHRINEFLQEEDMKAAGEVEDIQENEGRRENESRHENERRCENESRHETNSGLETERCHKTEDITKYPAVRFDNVSFGYEETKEILRNFSLDVNSGEQITLAGRTGAGKSTLFKLLLGLYEPWSGTVTVSGIDVCRIKESDRRKIFGYVEQTFHPVPGTVLNQITLGDERISRGQAEEALKTVGLYSVVKSLPDQGDTLYSAGIFSQGQIQLLSIARAIASDPKILLLDEITANLDSETEKKVLEALGAASGNRTVLSISHRLYEQKGGRLVEIE